MIVLPAIDLIGGQVVRLHQGQRSRMDVYGADPAAQAQAFAEAGARWVHVVDLSGALEEGPEARAANDAAIRSICALGSLQVDVGGGVRGPERVDQLLGYGCARVALGTPLVRDPAFAQAAATEHPGRLVADVACRDGQVRVNGWREGTGLALRDFVGRVRAMGFEHLVLTDVSRDGTGAGIDVDLYRAAAGWFGRPVVASGGVATLADVEALAAAGPSVVEGVIIGRALYEGTVDLGEALAVARAAEEDDHAV